MPKPDEDQVRTCYCARAQPVGQDDEEDVTGILIGIGKETAWHTEGDDSLSIASETDYMSIAPPLGAMTSGPLVFREWGGGSGHVTALASLPPGIELSRFNTTMEPNNSKLEDSMRSSMKETHLRALERAIAEKSAINEESLATCPQTACTGGSAYLRRADEDVADSGATSQSVLPGCHDGMCTRTPPSQWGNFNAYPAQGIAALPEVRDIDVGATPTPDVAAVTHRASVAEALDYFHKWDEGSHTSNAVARPTSTLPEAKQPFCADEDPHHPSSHTQSKSRSASVERGNTMPLVAPGGLACSTADVWECQTHPQSVSDTGPPLSGTGMAVSQTFVTDPGQPDFKLNAVESMDADHSCLHGGAWTEDQPRESPTTHMAPTLQYQTSISEIIPDLD